MKLVLLLILPLLLISIYESQKVYAEFGDFLFSFNGTDYDANFHTASIAIDSNDRIIVQDRYSTLRQIFDSEGKFLDSFNSINGTEGVYVAVDSNDRIFSLSPFDNIINIFNSTGNFLFNIDIGHYSNTLEIDSNNRIITANSTHIHIFNSNGVLIENFNGINSGGFKFIDIINIAIDSKDRILVADRGTDTLQIFDSDGIFINSISEDKDGAKFSALRSVVVDHNDRIFIVDGSNDFLQIFYSNSVFLENFSIIRNPDDVQLHRIYFLSDNTMLLLDKYTTGIYVYEGYQIEDLITENDNEPTFTFENKTYTQNDTITITGNTPGPQKVFRMEVYNPDNRIVAYWDTLSDYDANLSEEFDLSTLGDFYTAIYPERVINGTYTIIGDFGWQYDNYIKTFEFLYIIDRDHALENITGSFSKESYYKDDERVVLTVTTSEGYFSSIFNTELQDSNGNMIHKISEIINGDGEFTTSFYISNLPTSGNYTILLDTHSIYEPLEFYFQYTDFTLHNSQLNNQIQKAHQEIDYLKNELAIMNETIISLQSSISEILEFIQ